MSWVAIILTVAGTAYSAYSQNEATKAANSVKAKPFVPVDIPKTAAMAFAADKAGYDISDKDWQTRFPKLALGREQIINDVGQNVAGKDSLPVANAINKAGYGGTDLGNTEYAKSRELGMPVLALKNRSRDYFQQLLKTNPQRTAGLSGQDVTRIAIANTGGQNNFNQGVFQSNIGQYNSQIQQGIANQGAVLSGLGGLAGLLSQNQSYQRSPYETDPNYYNWMGNANQGAGVPGKIG